MKHFHFEFAAQIAAHYLPRTIVSSQTKIMEQVICGSLLGKFIAGLCGNDVARIVTTRPMGVSYPSLV